MQAEIWSTQVNCQELLYTFSHLSTMLLCTPSTVLSRFNIRECLFYIQMLAAHLRLMCLKLLQKYSQSRQSWMCVLKLPSRVYTILYLSDGRTDDQQHLQYDDGTSVASKLCVTVLFLQYLNHEVGCICFHER